MLHMQERLKEAGLDLDLISMNPTKKPDFPNGFTVGGTSTELGATEMEYLDGVTAGTAAASKAVVLDANKDIASIRNLTVSGNIVHGSSTLSAAETGVLDGVTAGTETASKAVVLDANKKFKLCRLGGKLYADFDYADEDLVQNVAVATAFAKTFSIPANTLEAGDIIRIKARGVVNDNNGTDTLALALKLGASNIATISATDVDDDDMFRFEAELHVVSIGATGSIVCETRKSDLAQPGSETYSYEVTALTPDTTGALAITVVATWSAAHAENIVALQNLIVERI